MLHLMYETNMPGCMPDMCFSAHVWQESNLRARFNLKSPYACTSSTYAHDDLDH
jgi:hypothetical protein